LTAPWFSAYEAINVMGQGTYCQEVYSFRLTDPWFAAYEAVNAMRVSRSAAPWISVCEAINAMRLIQYV